MSETFKETTGSFEDALRQVALFQDLGERDLTRLSRRLVELEVPRHALVVQDGETSTGLYVVSEGSVVVLRQTVGKPEQVLAHLHRGELFGELGIFSGGRHMASVRAIEPSRILRLTGQNLREFFSDHPEIEQKLQVTAARRHLANVSALLNLGRRREVRIYLAQPVQLEVAGTLRTAVLDNLSLDGLCLTGAPADWQAGRDVSFGLGLSEGLLRLKGRVLWRREQTVGLRFAKLTPNHDTIIQMAIRVALKLKKNAEAPDDDTPDSAQQG